MSRLEPDRTHVLLLHAGPDYFVGESGGFSSFDIEALREKVCYLALGHIHQPMLYAGWACNPRIAGKLRFAVSIDVGRLNVGGLPECGGTITEQFSREELEKLAIRAVMAEKHLFGIEGSKNAFQNGATALPLLRRSACKRESLPNN